MQLLEREAPLAEMEGAVRDATTRPGSLVLVFGEAGVGKTSLVRRLAADSGIERVLWGLCDDLSTPRPFGPFRDIAGQVGGPLAEVLKSGPLAEFGEMLLDELDSPPHPVVLVIEDAHWADEATLDVLRFLGRRVDRIRALLVVTYREDEVPSDHPLRVALGAVPAANIRRIGLAPLSHAAVTILAGSSDIGDLYLLTGGNPFYVTEILASANMSSVPITVRDAVMSRVRRLSQAGRECVEIASVVPSRIERWILDECGVAQAIDEAAGLGVLEVESTFVRFPHDLTRQAVESNLRPGQREDMNQRVLEVLVAHDAEPARLAHHAARANNSEAVSRYAPIAARRAGSLDSHRESVAHFRQALDQPECYSPEDLGDLFYEYARECWLIERHEEAEAALRRAVRVHTDTGDQAKLGVDLSLLSEVEWFLGRSGEAAKTSIEAITVLERTHSDSSLAGAYAQHARLAMVDRRVDEAVVWGEKAVALARQFGEIEVLAHALNTVGSARWMIPPYDNGPLLESLELARTKRLNVQAGRAYANLADGYLHHLDFNQAGRYLEEGLAFSDEHDLVTSHSRLLALHSGWCLETGRWDDAEEAARVAMAAVDVTRVIAKTVLGLLQMRRGDPSASETVQEAQRLADRTSDTQDLLPVGLARLELAWLAGTLESHSALASDVFGLARQSRSPRWMGEAAMWLHKVGVLQEPPSNAFEPYAFQIAGRWQEAAAAWAEIGRPYAEAEALAEAPDAEPLLQALEIFNGLGAKPRGATVRSRLKEMGVTGIPRGSRAATRANPRGLTARQLEVLQLLALDLTYQEIAERLYISTKTVDHHVSAVRLKLGVTTRADAVKESRRLGLLLSEDGTAERP